MLLPIMVAAMAVAVAPIAATSDARAADGATVRRAGLSRCWKGAGSVRGC